MIETNQKTRSITLEGPDTKREIKIIDLQKKEVVHELLPKTDPSLNKY